MSIDVIERGTMGMAVRPEAAGVVERRHEPRYVAVEDRLWLGWWDGEQFQTIGAHLVDISQGGAAICCPDGPQVGEDAWFCVVGPRLSGGARARVIGRGAMPDDPYAIRLRLQFQPRCPKDVLEVALGLIAAGSAGLAAS